MRVAAAIGIVFLVLAALAAADQPLGDLSTTIDLSSGDIRGVEAGQTITRIRPSQDPDEVSVLGAIRIDVSPNDVANRLADIVHFKKGPAVLEIGIFGTPGTTNGPRREQGHGDADAPLQWAMSLLGQIYEFVGFHVASSSRSIPAQIRHPVNAWLAPAG